MAYDPKAFSSSFTTLAILDYTGSPDSLAVGTVVLNSAVAPTQQTVGKEEIMVNSATGAALYATILTGLTGGDTYSIQFVESDTKNDTDKNPDSLLRGLATDTISSTGFSANDYSNQQDGGGAPMAKFVFTQRNASGVSHVITVPSVVNKFSRELSGEHFVCTAELMVAGAVTRA